MGGIPALIPVLCRIWVCYTDEIGGIWIEAVDLFFVCLAMCIAVIPEMKNTNKIRFITRFLILTGFLIGCGMGISQSLSMDYEISNHREKYAKTYENVGCTEEQKDTFVQELNKKKDAKDKLLNLSGMLSMAICIVFYRWTKD